MKTQTSMHRARKAIALMAFFLLSVPAILMAQDKTKPKEMKLKVSILKEGQDGIKLEIDTSFTSEKALALYLKEKGKKLELEALKEMEIALEIQDGLMDSLEKKITIMQKDITGDISDFQFDVDHFGDFEWQENRAEADYNDCLRDPKHLHWFGNYLDPKLWLQGITPWGKIRNIKIKDKKGGKKIVIRTEKMDGFYYYPMPGMPPCPPPPPKPPRVKKIKLNP